MPRVSGVRRVNRFSLRPSENTFSSNRSSLPSTAAMLSPSGSAAGGGVKRWANRTGGSRGPAATTPGTSGRTACPFGQSRSGRLSSVSSAVAVPSLPVIFSTLTLPSFSRTVPANSDSGQGRFGSSNLPLRSFTRTSYLGGWPGSVAVLRSAVTLTPPANREQ